MKVKNKIDNTFIGGDVDESGFESDFENILEEDIESSKTDDKCLQLQDSFDNGKEQIISLNKHEINVDMNLNLEGDPKKTLPTVYECLET